MLIQIIGLLLSINTTIFGYNEIRPSTITLREAYIDSGFSTSHEEASQNQPNYRDPNIHQPSLGMSMLPVNSYNLSSPVSFQSQNLSSNSYAQKTLNKLGIINRDNCIQVTHMTPMEIDIMYSQNMYQVRNDVLKDSTLPDEVVWALFEGYVDSLSYLRKIVDGNDIKRMRTEITERLDDRHQKQLIAQQSQIKQQAQQAEQQRILQKNIIQKQNEYNQLFGCSNVLSNATIAKAVEHNQTSDHQLLPQILPNLISTHGSKQGLLPTFAQSNRAQLLHDNNTVIPNEVKVAANYFFAAIQNNQTDQTTTFIAQQGLESIISTTSQTNPELQQALNSHAQQLYQALLDQDYQKGLLHLPTNPNMHQELQTLQTAYQDFYEGNDSDYILSQRYTAIQTTLQNPELTATLTLPADVAGFMQVHGLSDSILINYEQNAIQQQISNETIQIIQTVLQIKSTNPTVLSAAQVSVRLLQVAVGQVSQQTLLYNKLGEFAKALESVDLGWILAEYGPDMITGAFDSLVLPVQFAAGAVCIAAQAAAHPLQALQTAANALCIIGDGLQTVGKTLYQGALQTGSYVINTNPSCWYDDAGNLCKRSIDMAYDVSNQATDYIKTCDPHHVVRNISSLASGIYIAPLVSARAGLAVSAFTNSVRQPLLEKVTAQQTACAAIFAKGMEQARQFSYKARDFLQNVIQKAESTIQELLPQTELAAHTPDGTLIKFQQSTSFFQKVTDQLFLLAEKTKDSIQNTVRSLPLFSSESFSKYDRSDIIVPGLEKLIGIRQLEAWRDITKNFTDIGSTESYHRLYFNYIHWLNKELQPIQNHFKSLNLSFKHGGRMHQILDVDLLHVFLGDIIPSARKISGMHYLSPWAKNLYNFELTNSKDSFVKKVNIFRKNNGIAVGQAKPSTLFPKSWSMQKCVDKGIEALGNITDIWIVRNELIIFGKANCGFKIQMKYNRVNKKIESFYPYLEAPK